MKRPPHPYHSSRCRGVGRIPFSVNYAFTNVLQPHQQQRIRVTLGMEEDLRGAGYNVNQSKIAIGSGGIWGKGFLNGTQTKLKYVPEQHTDFIFCTIGEEEGFVGSSITLLLFLALILRVITIAERQPRPFARVYGYCVASYFIFHLAINVGMVIGLCPVIGIPLPLLQLRRIIIMGIHHTAFSYCCALMPRAATIVDFTLSLVFLFIIQTP